MGMEDRWNDTDRRKTEVLTEKPVPLPLYPPQIPHGLTQDRSRVSAVKGRRITAWIMARNFRGLKVHVNNIKIHLLPHREHSSSPLQRPTCECCS
jgi:hypothetical protein